MDVQTDAIRNLTREIPLNDFGLPTGIYNPALLPLDDYLPRGSELAIVHHVPSPSPPHEHEQEPQKNLAQDLTLVPQEPVREYRIAGFKPVALQQAFVPLQYEEGFPAFESGLPFWGRLDFEPLDAHLAFEAYLKMNLGTLATDLEEDYDGTAASGTRSIATLCAAQFPDDQINTMVQIFTGYYHTYYWGLRAHAFDLFRTAEFSKRQELRALETQNDHYYQARRLRHKLQQYMDSDEEFWDLMTPKVAVGMLKDLMQLERISAGIPAAGPPGEAEGRSFEAILRTTANTNRKGGQGNIIDESGEVLDRALEDPASVEILQELIIRGNV